MRKGAVRAAGWRMDRYAGYLLALPATLVMFGLMMYPLFHAMALSFMEWSPNKASWIGLANYARLARDPLFWKSLANTFFYTVMNLTAGMTLSLLFALLMDRRHPLTSAVRAVVFLPAIVSMPVAAMAWIWMLEPGFGLLNQTLASVGMAGREPIPWLNSVEYAPWSIVMVNIWKGTGLSALLLLAGLQDIPQELYEAAAMEGAGPARRVLAITLPLLRPVILVVLIIKGIGSFKTFDQVYIMTGGGPLYSTETILGYLYRHGFEYFAFGYASAIGMVFFVIVVALSLAQGNLLKEKAA